MNISSFRIGVNYIFVCALIAVVVVYALYHATSGDRGFLAFLRLRQQIEQSRAELDIVRAQRLKYERDVKLLRDESLDLDLLDEQARRLLGYAEKDEKVYNLE
jgi:cell division protein FtsB